MIIASLCVMVFIPVPVAVFASLFVMGLGIANLAPILISAASRDKKMESVKAITAVTTVGYGGLLAGPASSVRSRPRFRSKAPSSGSSASSRRAFFAVRRHEKVFA